MNPAEPPGSRLGVLVVCTGNVCRSPAAQLLLAAGLGSDPGIDVASAGLDALVGEPVDERMARRLRARGVSPDGFAARQASPEDLRGADLVLTMTAAQRSTVVTRVPAAVRRTFTLLEFAGLAELVRVDPELRRPADRLAALVREAPRARAQRAAGDDDIEDPYRRPDEVFGLVLDRIETATRSLLDRISPVAGHAPSPEGGALLAGPSPIGVKAGPGR